MNPGKLWHKISILKSTVAPSTSYGEVINTWATLVQTWADIQPIMGSLSGRENFVAGQILSQVDTRITIRYRPITITPSMQVKWKDQYYNIETVLNNGERNKDIILMCQKNDVRTAT